MTSRRADVAVAPERGTPPRLRVTGLCPGPRRRSTSPATAGDRLGPAASHHARQKLAPAPRRLNLASGAPPADPRQSSARPVHHYGDEVARPQPDPGVYLLVLPEHAHALTAAPERSIWPVRCRHRRRADVRADRQLRFVKFLPVRTRSVIGDGGPACAEIADLERPMSGPVMPDAGGCARIFQFRSCFPKQSRAWCVRARIALRSGWLRTRW
jgi:hypothetical protein